MSIFNDVNATESTEISATAIPYAVETPRSEHQSLQWKRSSPAVNRGLVRPTDSPWLLLYAALTTIYTTVGDLSREFRRLLWHFVTHRRKTIAEGDGALHSLIEDSLLRNGP